MSVYLTLSESAETQEQASVFACRAAKRLGAHLEGMSAMPDPLGALMMTGAGTGLYMPGSTEVVKGVEQAQQETREKLEDNFKTVCEKEGLAAAHFSVKHMQGLPEQMFGREAILGDLLVFPHDCAKAGGPYGVAFEYTLMSRRQPVVIAGVDPDPDLSTVVIAWDGSPEAARAILLHEKIICAADRVIIAQNESKIDPQDEDGPEDPRVVRQWLENRKVATTMRSFSGDIADGLLQLSKQEKAGLLVAGAFGHSRMEEMIFGGVSRSLLRSDDGPALALAH